MTTSHEHDGKALDEYLSCCPSIAEDARYWFFRTQGGMLFEPFITSQSIAIGYPSINLKTLLGCALDSQSRKSLTRQIQKADATEQRPGLAAGQLLTFTHLMKEGDYVIIPSWGSRQLAIGQIVNKLPFQDRLTFDGKDITGFDKKRKVKWLTRRIPRDTVNPNLYRMLFAHQTITDVTEWAQWIDILLFDFFKKGNNYHYNLEVNRADGINARDLFQACVDLLKLADDFTAEIGIDQDSGAMDTRINLNSPGDIELITSAAKYIFVIAAIVVGINGGGIKFNLKKAGLSCNVSTDGLIKTINKFLSDRKNRQLADSLKDKLNNLQVDSPADVVKILDHINKHKP
jgi:hypothetical protein